jgi:hypothetical protein
VFAVFDQQNLCAAQDGGLVTGGTGCDHFPVLNFVKRAV